MDFLQANLLYGSMDSVVSHSLGSLAVQPQTQNEGDILGVHLVIIVGAGCRGNIGCENLPLTVVTKTGGEIAPPRLEFELL